MKNVSIRIAKNDQTMNMVINLFSIIDREAHNKDISFDGNTFTIREKSEEEINKLFENTEALKGKLLDMFHNNAPFVQLNGEQSELFRKCVHAAYYWITEKEGVQASSNPFMKHYNDMKLAGII